MKLMRLKRSGKAPLSAQAAIALGGLLVTWGYRRWSRKKAARSGEVGARGREAPPEAERLAEKFHSLDEETKAGHIPKDLEREPKNLEQSVHPG